MHFRSALMPSFETAPYIQYQKVQGRVVSAFMPVETKYKSSTTTPLLRKEGLGVVDIRVVDFLITIRQYGIPLIIHFFLQNAEYCR